MYGNFFIESDIDNIEDSIDVDEVVDIVIDNLSMFQYITFSKKLETEDYIIITVNANNPDQARKDLSSFKFAHATNLDVVPLRKTKDNGYQLEVLDENAEPFDKDIYIRIRKGGEFNFGVKNEIDMLNIIQSSIDEGHDNILFHDMSGDGYSVKNAVSVRDCSKDPGSRMGNRADIEIKDKNGILHKISLKKESAYKIAGLVRKMAPQSYKIGREVRKYFQENGIPFTNRYITVKITNPELYKWCWFGNDIDKNGAVIIADASFDKVQKDDSDDSIDILVLSIVSPNDGINALIEEHQAYLFMKLTKRGAVDVYAAVRQQFAKRYEIDDLVISGVNDGK